MDCVCELFAKALIAGQGLTPFDPLLLNRHQSSSEFVVVLLSVLNYVVLRERRKEFVASICVCVSFPEKRFRLCE